MTTGIFGPRCSESFAEWDRESSFWKTSQATFQWDSGEFSETWPRAGSMRSGIVFRHRPSAPLTGATGSSSWPTPEALNHMGYQVSNGKKYPRLGEAVKMWPTPKASASGPDFARMNRERSGGDDLATEVAKFPTPRSRDWKGKSQRGSTPGNRDCLPNVVGGQLNADWVSLLMGFPADWTVVDGSAEFRASRKIKKTASTD